MFGIFKNAGHRIFSLSLLISALCAALTLAGCSNIRGGPYDSTFTFPGSSKLASSTAKSGKISQTSAYGLYKMQVSPVRAKSMKPAKLKKPYFISLGTM